MTQRLLLLFVFLLASCNTAQQKGSITSSTVDVSKNGVQTLAILGTNDIHGNIAPMKKRTRDTQPIGYETGGLANIASYVDILRSEFGSNFIWLDAGDEFQGTVESNLNLGAPMVQFFNQKNLNAAAIGNHEFDFGQEVLNTRMQEAKYPYVAANILIRQTGKHVDFPNTHRHVLIQAGDLKVGVIGLSTLDTPTTTRPANVTHLNFEELKEATLREVAALREKGAQVILLTAHVGLVCDLEKGLLGNQMRKPSDSQGDCGSRDEMVQLLSSLPQGTIDAVVAGHSHQIIHHWIAGVPVIQAGAYGTYLNVVYLSYDWSQNKVLPDETRIEGPIPVCTQVFKNQNDCNGDRPSPKLGRGPLVTPRFHGKEIHASQQIKKWAEPILKGSEAEKKRVIGYAKHKIEHHRMKESPLGNLVADALREHSKSDFGLVNFGGIRTDLEEGKITYGDLFRTFPFDNTLSILKVTGQELLHILQIAESGSRGLNSVSGLKIKLIDLKLEAPFQDLVGDGKFERWKVNRLIDVKTSAGDPIDPNHYYQLATVDFLVQGGDDLKWAMARIPTSRIQLDTGYLIRDVILSYIQKHGTVNTESHPCFNPQAPRLAQEKAPSIKKRSKNHKNVSKNKS